MRNLIAADDLDESVPKELDRLGLMEVPGFPKEIQKIIHFG